MSALPRTPGRTPGRSRRRTRLLVAAIGAGLALPALASLPSQAVVGSAAVTLEDCDVVLNPFDVNQVVSRDGTWTTSIAIDHPSPIPVDSGQTIGLELGEVPAGTFPEALTDTALYLFADFENGRGYNIGLEPTTRYLGDFDPTQPLDLGAPEIDDIRYYDSGHYALGLKKLEVTVFGRNAQDEGTTYVFSCDQPNSAVPIVEFGVYDPEADASISLSDVEARQGEVLAIDGRDFSRTPGAVLTTVGGEPGDSFAVDEIGWFSGPFTVPEFAPPGTVTVKAQYAGETALATLLVTAKKAALTVPRSAAVGRKLAVSGALFKPGEKVSLLLKKRGGGKGTKVYRTSARAGADGTFTKAVKLKKAARGPWKIAAAGAESGRKAGAKTKVG